MFLYFKPLLFTIIIFLGFEVAANFYDTTKWVLEALLLTVIFASFKVVKGWKVSIMPLLFFVGSVILLFFVNQGVFLHIYIFLSSIVYYLILYSAYVYSFNPNSEVNKKISFITALANLFIWFAGLLAVYLNMDYKYWQILIVIALVVFLTTLHILNRLFTKKSEKNFFYSFLLAYALVVLGWAAYYLPFGYLTLAALIFGSYFVMISYIISNNQGGVKKMNLISDIIIFIIASIIVLVSTKWDIALDTGSIF